MQSLQQHQMRLKILQSVDLQKLLQVFVKMAVVIIIVNRIVKIMWRMSQMGGGFSYAHNLQRLFTTDARTHFKISLKRTG